eukprot:5406452-Amphidinium_carterae.2
MCIRDRFFRAGQVLACGIRLTSNEPNQMAVTAYHVQSPFPLMSQAHKPKLKRVMLATPPEVGWCQASKLCMDVHLVRDSSQRYFEAFPRQETLSGEPSERLQKH